jgi:hypothetical protein
LLSALIGREDKDVLDNISTSIKQITIEQLLAAVTAEKTMQFD